MCRTNIEIDHINCERENGPFVNTCFCWQAGCIPFFCDNIFSTCEIINYSNIQTYHCTNPLWRGLINWCTKQIQKSLREVSLHFQWILKPEFDEVEDWQLCYFLGGFEPFSDKLIKWRIVGVSDLGYPGAPGRYKGHNTLGFYDLQKSFWYHWWMPTAVLKCLDKF